MKPYLNFSLTTLTAIAAASLLVNPAMAQDKTPTAASAKAALAYTTFPPVAAPAAFVEPPAPAGTVAYNRWLGAMFNGVLFNTSDPAKQAQIAGRIVHHDYVQHNLLVAQGRKGILDFMPYIFKSMPDTRFVLHEVIATQDRVITRWTWTGTITGEGFLGVSPKGQRIEFDGIDIWAVKDGQLYEHWDQFDWPRVFAELGTQGLPPAFYDVAAQPYSR